MQTYADSAYSLSLRDTVYYSLSRSVKDMEGTEYQLDEENLYETFYYPDIYQHL